MSWFSLWPPQLSRHAERVDLLIGTFGVMVWLLTLPIFVLLVVFLLRYRRSRTAVNREHPVDRNVWLEISWSAIPFLLTIGFFIWAAALFLDTQRPSADAFTIHVVGKQWMWKFQHPSGVGEINTLHVPANTPVRLQMTSQDVIHSLYVPALRIKMDVLPGRFSQLWFTAENTGAYPLRCAEFCGADHSVMGGRLVVLPRAGYAQWVAAQGRQGTDTTLADQGGRLYRQLGCSGCHGPAAIVKAPPLAGISGRTVGLANGQVVIADEQYLADSILLPNKQVVGGYPPIMPTYANVIAPDQVNALVAYLKTLGAPQGSPQ